tara:strand:- start:23 stop:1429 length:1407 start_codon:yes stop_codon:yes gene_type:complete
MDLNPQHGVLEDSQSFKEEISRFRDRERENSTPLFPKHIFNLLPKFLKETCGFFDEGRERDVFLASSLTVLSGCMPGVHFQHDGKTYQTNLFLFVIAPAASGKGKMNYGKYLAQPIQRKYIKDNELKKEVYQSEMARFRATPAKERLYVDEPQEPEYQYLFIPANSSSASFVETMARMPSSILFESEADTLGNTLKQDWSGYSDVLRKAFEHETHSQNRKGSGNYKEIENPCLTVALSGTPGQLKAIIPNAEDGLFSRFMFYQFEGDEDFRPVFGSKSKPIPYSDLLEPYANELLRLFEKCEAWGSVQFSWKEEQEDELQSLYEKWTRYYTTIHGTEVKSIIFRSAIIITRLAAILTVLRTWENQDYSNKHQVCSGKDFDIALALAETFIEHSMHMYSRLLRRDPTESFSLKKKRFYESLPKNFETNEAEKLGLDLDIKDRTVRKYLKEWDINGLVVKLDQGKYERAL